MRNPTHDVANWRVGRVGGQPHLWFRHAPVDQECQTYPPIPIAVGRSKSGKPVSLLAHSWEVLAAHEQGVDYGPMSTAMAHAFHRHLGPWFDKFVEDAQ